MFVSLLGEVINPGLKMLPNWSVLSYIYSDDVPDYQDFLIKVLLRQTM